MLDGLIIVWWLGGFLHKNQEMLKDVAAFFRSYLLDIYLVLKCPTILYWFSLCAHLHVHARAPSAKVTGARAKSMHVCHGIYWHSLHAHTHFLTSSRNSWLPVALSHKSWPDQNKFPSKVQRKYQTNWSLAPKPSVTLGLFGFFSLISVLMLFSLCHLLCRAILLCLSLAVAPLIA